MLDNLSRWFQSTPLSQEYTAADRWILFLILALGVFVRFWGLGNVGLHGDEETMAMPTMAILDSGQPYLPSGMYYSRALAQLYLMAGSVSLFGETEWAFRVPSAIVGSLAGLVAFFMGKRFLVPHVNLAFVGTITFLPSMIEISQTARMYVFLVVGVMWFAACIFRWEANGRLTSLLLALFVWCLALHFHRLAIFAAPIFLFPGLSRQSWRLLGQGSAAFAIGFLAFNLYGAWTASKYPQPEERPDIPLDDSGSGELLPAAVTNIDMALIAGAVLTVLVALAGLVTVLREAGLRSAGPPVLVAGGLLAMSTLNYHVAAILLLFGIVFWLRDCSLHPKWLWGAIALAGLLAIIHLSMLYSTGLYPGRQLIGAVVGTPSVWPVLRFLEYSPVAGALYVLVFLYGLWKFSHGDPLPKHFLFFGIAVWAPLLILGIYTWYMPPRYAQGQLGLFLLCAFAGVMWYAMQRHWISLSGRPGFKQAVALAAISVAFINPVQFVQAINPSYDHYPDHKGAAEYIKGLNLNPEAILIAEDVLQQTYYLGSVDYFLREIGNSGKYAVVRDGELVDQYTAARVIGTGSELEELLTRSRGKELYIIGSGENFVGKRRSFRGEGIREVLESDKLRIVYTGRDGKTRVWKLSE